MTGDDPGHGHAAEVGNAGHARGQTALSDCENRATNKTSADKRNIYALK